MKTFLTLAILTLSIQSSFAQSSEQDRLSRTIREVETAAKSLSKLDTSCSQNSDCVVLALGSKACGGAADYMMASKKNPHFTDIANLAKRSSILEAEYNMRYNVMSDCMMRMPPKYDCSLNRCVQLGVSY